MTWGQFKQAVAEQGVTDDTPLDLIDGSFDDTLDSDGETLTPPEVTVYWSNGVACIH